MKIALIVHDLHDHGGHSLYTRILADEFSRRHEVAVFANQCEQPPDSNWQSHHVRAWRSTALSTVQTFPLGLREHERLLASHEIRHAQGYCGGNPNVVTAHICVAAYLKSLRDISARHRASLKLMATAEARFYRRYEGRVIAVSRKIADELREFYEVRNAISIVHHGVDLSRFDRAIRDSHRYEVRSELCYTEDQTIALYAGDLTKAHVHLKELTEKTPNVEFVIVSGSTRYLWRAPNVRFLAPTRHLERYYAAADAFVFPTTYDAFGMVVLEAMAAGLPVFSSNQAGAAELISAGEDGFVIPLKDWVRETNKTLSDLARLRTIGRAAKQKARDLGWPSVCAAVEKIYSEIARP